MAKGLGIGFGDEMKDVTKDMVNAIPSEFDTDIKANINSDFSRGTADTAALDVTIPLTVDGVTLTKIVSRIQWSQNTEPKRKNVLKSSMDLLLHIPYLLGQRICCFVRMGMSANSIKKIKPKSYQ